jgi:hypothetical protein
MLTKQSIGGVSQCTGVITMTQNNNQNSKESDDKLLKLVEEALLRRATGYEDASGKPVPPDVRAAMYWLENRSPARWKKRQSDNQPGSEVVLTEEENAL